MPPTSHSLPHLSCRMTVDGENPTNLHPYFQVWKHAQGAADIGRVRSAESRPPSPSALQSTVSLWPCFSLTLPQRADPGSGWERRDGPSVRPSATVQATPGMSAGAGPTGLPDSRAHPCKQRLLTATSHPLLPPLLALPPPPEPPAASATRTPGQGSDLLLKNDNHSK